MSYILILSLALAKPQSLHEAALYQEAHRIEKQLTNPTSLRAWNVIGNFQKTPSLLYQDLINHSFEVREARANAVYVSNSNPQKIQMLFQQESDPRIQAILLKALGKNGDCSHMPIMENALSESSPIRLPPRTKAALDALAHLAQREDCSYQTAINLIIPMLSSFSKQRREGAARALSLIKPSQLSPVQKNLLYEATQREPNPSIRANLIRAVAQTNPTNELQFNWFSDPATPVRIAAIETYPNNPLVLELLKDNELPVQLKAIEILGKKGEHLNKLISSGATIDVEQKARIGNTRQFAQAIHALKHSKNIDLNPYLNPERPTIIRRIATSKLEDLDQLQKLRNEDSEPEVQMAATKRMLELNPEDLKLLSELLNHPKRHVQHQTLYHLQENPEGALEQQLWQLLQSNNTLTIQNTLACLSLLELSLSKEEALPYVEPLQKSTNLNTLIPLHKILRQLNIEHKPIEWPKNIENIRQATIKTKRGDLHIELFPQYAPLSVWNFADLVENGDYDNKPFFLEDDFLSIGPKEPLNIVPERNIVPIKKGTIVLRKNPIHSQLFISLKEAPFLSGDYTVIGQITDGINLLRNIRSEERSDQVIIYRTSL